MNAVKSYTKGVFWMNPVLLDDSIPRILGAVKLAVLYMNGILE
jgi:hypothetical protein